MADRLDLHSLLCELLGSSYCYFQPPSNVKMQYPAIVYSLSDIKNSFANNDVYSQQRLYTVTLIDKRPESSVMDALSRLPRCKFSTHYVADNLNHYVFNLYF